MKRRTGKPGKREKRAASNLTAVAAAGRGAGRHVPQGDQVTRREIRRAVVSWARLCGIAL